MSNLNPIHQIFLENEKLKDLNLSVSINSPKPDVSIVYCKLYLNDEEIFDDEINAELMPNLFLLFSKDQKTISENLFSVFFSDFSILYYMWESSCENDCMEFNNDKFKSISEFIINSIALFSNKEIIDGNIIMPRILKLYAYLLDFFNGFSLAMEGVNVLDDFEDALHLIQQRVQLPLSSLPYESTPSLLSKNVLEGELYHETENSQLYNYSGGSLT